MALVDIAARVARAYNDGMEGDIDRIVIPADRIQRRVEELARQIGATYEPSAAEGVVFVAILSGAIVFLADLIRKLPFKMKIGLVTVTSYPGKRTQAGPTHVLEPLQADVRGRHVLLVDDILDTGGTLRRVRQDALAQRPASLRICVLLRKPSKAPADMVADFVGFDIADEFVVGYGLDYDDHYRNYPSIATLREHVYV